MNKKLIRLTESDLHRIVKESVNRIIREGLYDNEQDFYNEFGNQSQYPAYEYMPQFEGELSMTAQYSPEDYERRMSDWDPEYFLDGKDEIYKSKLPGDYRTKK
jgi:hypothetical protein